MKPYPLDHCVLPTQSLAAARARLSALGFTVAADAAHPFGTANCCVFFEDDTYLEPLALADEDLAERAIHEGNAFVDRNDRYRAAHGNEGFSAFVIGTADADADHARFVAGGLSAGPALSFSRPFVDSDGEQSEASFKLAFAAPVNSETFFFTCERVKAPTVDHSLLQRHANSVVGISQILLIASQPAGYVNFFTMFCGSEPTHSLDFRLANATVSLMPPDLAGSFGIDSDRDGELCLSGIVFRTQNVSTLRQILAGSEVRHILHQNRIVVPPASGQGATFVFQEFD